MGKQRDTWETRGFGSLSSWEIRKLTDEFGTRRTARLLEMPKSTVHDIRKNASPRKYALPSEGYIRAHTAMALTENSGSAKSTSSSTEGSCGASTTQRGGRSCKSQCSKKGKKLLIIPDAHAHPEYDNDRFCWLGDYIHEVQPDIVVCIGDFADMPSLSLYDKGKRSFEGRRYVRDVSASVEALENLHEYGGHVLAEAEKWIFYGNHEDRINRAANDAAQLEGLISVGDLQFKRHGWKEVSFGESASIGGIRFSHYFTSGVLGRPIGGCHIGSSLCSKLHQSAVQGHSHLLDHAERTRPDGQKIFGLSVGCYTHPKMIEGWNRSTHHTWWRGVVLINELDGEGYYDRIEFRTMRSIRRDHEVT